MTTRRVHDWQLKNPFSDLMSLLDRNPQIRERDDVNEPLQVLADGIAEVKRQMQAAVHRQAIADAEHVIDTARNELKVLEGVDPIPPF